MTLNYKKKQANEIATLLLKVTRAEMIPRVTRVTRIQKNMCLEELFCPFTRNALNFHFDASLPFTVTTSRALFATTCSFK